MNKMTKAAVAIGAAVVLLLGGGGTLAYWNGSVALGDATINTGKLTVVAVAPTAPATGWTVSNGTVVNQAIPDISTFRAVPGDTIKYTRQLTIDAQGTNLAFTVVPTVTKGTSTTPEIEGILNATTATVTSIVPTASGGGAVTVTGSGPYRVTSPGTLTATVEMTIPWLYLANTPGSANPPTNNDSQLKAFSLTALTVAVTQVQP